MQTLEVVRTALEQKSLSGIVELLNVIRRDYRAAGCVVWEATPKSVLIGAGSTGSLFVLAQHFDPKRVQASWNLDVNSPIGQAVALNKRYECADVRSQDRQVAESYPFTVDPYLTGVCAIPISFPFPDKSKGALALYLRRGPFFAPQLVEHIQQTADLFPSLHQVIRNHVSLTLIDDVTRTLQSTEAEPGMALTAEQVSAKVQAICKEVAQTFGCVESSIYLEDSTKAPGVYSLAATTLDRDCLEPAYRADPTTGLTGWVLHKAAAWRIFDLADMQRIQAEDPEMSDLVWRDPMNILQFARAQLNLTRPEQVTPPLSWMGAPISVANRVLGVIRCCISRQGPFYFAERELKLLGIVAAHLGQFWSNYLARKKMDQENQLWRKVVSQVSFENKRVQEAIDKPVPAIAPGVEEQAWTALGALSDDIEKSVAIAATEVHTGGGSTSPAESAGETMRQLLTTQIECYKKWADSVQARYKAQTDLQVHNERQTRTYLDLAHQLRSPILAAYQRVQQTLDKGLQDGEVRNSLVKLRGLCGKARTVTMSVRLFADLAKSETLNARLIRILAGDLRQLAIECADDTQASVDSTRDLRFDVDKKSDENRKGFDALQTNVVLGDRDLMQQAISNILDNAGKYAKGGSVVRIAAGLTRSGWFHVSVYNKPFFRPKNSEDWKKHGWRGEEAQDVTAEGSGVGLYIADKVMAAHNGKLDINPWNSEGMTEVKLLFPVAGA